jgi:parallel beta-helix repeat protein
MKNSLRLSICLVCLFLAALCYGGLLNPTTPPTAGTMKPLDQVEPRTPITSVPCVISQSGSYYLTKNLTATGVGSISIIVDDVTLDLCGFTLTGPGSGLNYGIYIDGRKNIEIRNGTIKNFGYDGICDADTDGGNRRMINLCVINNGRHGIYLDGAVTGAGDLVRDCVVSGNGSSFAGEVCGIYVNSNAMLTGNSVSLTGSSSTTTCYGIRSYEKCTIVGNKIYYNGIWATSTVYGIYAVYGSTISGNTVYNNGKPASTVAYGISADTGSIISGNTVRSNYGRGISAAASCRIIENISFANTTHGITAGDNSTISQNTANSNQSDGINAGDHATVTENTVTSNYTSGITCTGGTIAKNTVSLNNTSATAGKGGIVVSYHSQIKENTLEGNSKNNIYVTGYRNSVEGNVMSGSDYGINFGSTGNVYLNNRASSNGVNYNQAGNTDGGGNISF